MYKLQHGKKRNTINSFLYDQNNYRYLQKNTELYNLLHAREYNLIRFKHGIDLKHPTSHAH